ATLTDALKRCLDVQELTFVIHEEDKTIIIKEKPERIQAPETPMKIPLNVLIDDIEGRIVDAGGFPVEGATVTVRGTNVKAVTNVDGRFSLTNIPPNSTLIITSV